MQIEQLQNYLYQAIPLTKAMQLEVTTYQQDYLSLSAPLAANVNHKGTVFGGSLNAVTTLCGWSLLAMKLNTLNVKAKIIIQKSQTEYRLPVTDDFTAHCEMHDAVAFNRFIKLLKKRGRARINLNVYIYTAERIAVAFIGTYVATTRKL